MPKLKARLFGNIMLQRGICQECGGECFVCKDMTSSCCSAPTIPTEEGYVSKEVDYVKGQNRRYPNKASRLDILEKQHNKCYWCGREFGTCVISPKGIVHILAPVWDHYIPYSLSYSSDPSEFVASCPRCNSHKSAKLIVTIQDEDLMREMLKRRWYSGGWADVDTAGH